MFLMKQSGEGGIRMGVLAAGTPAADPPPPTEEETRAKALHEIAV